MDMREAFSKFKKKIPRPHPLAGSRRKTDRVEAEADRERANSTGSPLPSETHIVAGGGDRNRANTDGRHVDFTDRPPQSDSPEPMPPHPGESDRGGKQADADRGEISKRRWFAMGSKSSREGTHLDAERIDRVYPSPASPPFPQSGKPNST